MIIQKIVNFFFEKKQIKKRAIEKEKPYFFKSKEESELKILFKDFVGLKEVIRLRGEINERNLPKDEKSPCFYR